MGYQFFGGGTPLPLNVHRYLEVKVEIERGILVGINKFKKNCWLTQVYCWRKIGGQEDHRRWNYFRRKRRGTFPELSSSPPFERLVGRRRSSYLKFLLTSYATVVDPHRHRQIVQVDKGDALLLTVLPHRAISQPCSHLLRRTTSPSSQPLPWRGNSGYRSSGTIFKQASKKAPRVGPTSGLLK